MTNLQKRFLDSLNEYGYDIFNLEMIRNTGDFSDSEIFQVLRTLIRSEIIIRIERGKYLKNDFNNEFVIGNFLAPDGGIAYWTALNYHGLTEQFANVIFVQTAKRRSAMVMVNNLKFKLIKINSNKIMGYKVVGFGNHKYKITDVEKTLVDCFDLPQHAGWYQEIIKAFNRANINFKKLVKYCKAINNKSVTKRLAYLSELLNKEGLEEFITYAKSILSDEYSLFEIDGIEKGKYNSRWKLIINIPEKEIKEIANS